MVVSKKEKKEIEKEVESKIRKNVEKKVEKKIEKEVEKKIDDRLKGHANKFKDEFRKQAIGAISAAFAFLIALSWREPIQGVVNNFVSGLGFDESIVYFQLLSAVIITIVAVLMLMLFAKWNSK